MNWALRKILKYSVHEVSCIYFNGKPFEQDKAVRMAKLNIALNEYLRSLSELNDK